MLPDSLDPSGKSGKAERQIRQNCENCELHCGDDINE